jgi:hypothetical protein
LDRLDSVSKGPSFPLSRIREPVLTNFNEENPPIPQKKGLRWQIEIFFKTLKENLKIKVLSLTQEPFGNTPTYRALGPNECAAYTLFKASAIQLTVRPSANK